MEVRIATTVAKRMTNHLEDFWICILIAFILCGFLSARTCVAFSAGGGEHYLISK
jgi:hypothetical protein